MRLSFYLITALSIIWALGLILIWPNFIGHSGALYLVLLTLASSIGFLISIIYGHMLCDGEEKDKSIKITSCINYIGLGVLAIYLVINLNKDAEIKKELNIASTSLQIDSIGRAIEMYKMSTGSIPEEKNGLHALLVNPGVEGWSGPYLPTDTKFFDSWGNEVVYRIDDKGYFVISLGGDQTLGTEDDISSKGQIRD